MTATARIRQAEYTRRIKAMIKAVGDPTVRVGILPDGSVGILTPGAANDPDPGLDAELEAWGKKHGYG